LGIFIFTKKNQTFYFFYLTNLNNIVRFVKQLGNDLIYNWHSVNLKNFFMEEENVIFYYFNEKGQKLYTPNDMFAKLRADELGTFEVYVEKN